MQPLVGIIMGSKSDWETMSHASETLNKLGVPHEVRVISAHRAPDLLFEYASTAEERGLQIIIAAAGGAAPPGRRDSRQNRPAGPRRADGVAGPERDGLASIDGANAGRNPRRHAGNRQARRHQRGPARNNDPRQQGPEVPPGDS